MWSLNNSDTVYHLPNGGSYSIGRKSTDIILDDQSISRRHALLIVQDDEVFLTDENSRFGTIINGSKVSSKQMLHDGDIIKFGQGTSSFKLKKQDLVFCCSNMTSDVKEHVLEKVKKLGGRMILSWSPACTHLVMTAVTITAKVVNALSSCRSIVSIAWLQDSVQCLNEKKVLPLANSYIPELNDPNLVHHSDISLKPMPVRRKLFSNKNIYFLNKKQYLLLQYCLKAAGGRTHLLTEVTEADMKQLATDNALVVDPIVTAPSLNEVKQFLMQSNSRLISESEIGYAILHCSLSRYCNPKFSGGCSQIPSQLPPPSLPIDFTQPSVEPDSILALNSEALTCTSQSSIREGTINEVDETIIKEQTPASASVTSNIISSSNETILAPDSFVSSTQPLSSQKRRRLDVDESIQCNSSKRKRCSVTEVDVSLPVTPHQSLDVNTKFLSSRQPTPRKLASVPKVTDSSVPKVTDLTGMETQEDMHVEPPNSTAASSMFAGLRSQRRKIKQEDSETVRETLSGQQHINAQDDNEELETNGSSVLCGTYGFISARKPQKLLFQVEQMLDEERHSVLAVVEAVDLLRNLMPSVNSVVHSNRGLTRNFKTFRKIRHSRYHSSVSRLIGGQDLS